MLQAATPSPRSEWNFERAARNAVRAQLERLHAQGRQAVTAFSYEDAVRRGQLAESFVQHPYWDVMSKMLSGTIQAETEELLAGSEHQDVNRASVAICRKLLKAPHIDIEQGRMAEEMKSKAMRGHSQRGQRSAEG